MKSRSLLSLCFLISASAFVIAILETQPAVSAAVSGEAVYRNHCASCHDQGVGRAPQRSALQQMTSARILRTLDFGMMMSIAYPLHRDEREAVASYLGKPGHEPGPPQSAYCAAGKPLLAGDSAGNWNGWSATTTNTRFQNSPQARLTAAQVPSLRLKWAFGFAGDVTAFGAVTVFNGTLLTGSAGGGVYALDAKTGCIHWIYQANGPVRSAPLVVRDGARTTVIFDDQIGWVYALDARTGKSLWTRKVEEHDATRLTGSVVSHSGVVYVPAASWEETRTYDPKYPCCTFRGSITALRVHDGGLVWKTFMVPEPKRTGVSKVGTPQFGPSGAGVWSSPTIDARRGVMFVTTGDNYSHPPTATSDAVMALELKTGRILWTQQTYPNDAYASACQVKGPNCPEEDGPDYDFGSSALLIHTAQGRDILAAGQKSGMVYALDPDNKGKILWQVRVGKGGLNGGVQWGMASDGEKLYAATSDGVRLAGGLSSSAGPIGLATFDAEKGGGLTALKLEDGSKAWFAQPQPCDPPKPGCSPAQSAALTAIAGAVFSGSLDGHLRAFSADDGKVIWDFDTAKEFTTVNGVAAKGGSLDGAGPAVSGEMLFVNSGYPRQGGMPGNVLLAFGADSDSK
jgi:polyvinyl alcohol dehydrogenase (cytochrome)